MGDPILRTPWVFSRQRPQRPEFLTKVAQVRAFRVEKHERYPAPWEYIGTYWNNLEHIYSKHTHIYIYITYGNILEHMCYYILWLSYVYIYMYRFDFGKLDKYHVDMQHISRRHNLLNLQMQHVCSADCRSWKFENTQTESDNKTC